ncbi:MAG: formyltransferase family protein [Polyangiaceae bacterium]
MTRPLRIGYFGLPLGSVLLAADGHRIEWAVLSPLPQPGRRRLRHHVDSERVIDLMDEEWVGASWQTAVSELLAAHPCDLIVSWFFTRRILGEWIARAPLGGIGAHPSLLPKYRGPDPFYAVIDAGESATGVTVHRLTDEYDTGKMLLKVSIPVGERNAWQLARALDRPSLSALREVTRAFAQGRPPREQDQNEEQATYAPQPKGEALRVDWTWPTDRVLRRIRALSPVPGLALVLGGEPFLVISAEPCRDFPRSLLPGEAYLGDRLVLRTGDGAISVERAALDDGNEDEELVTYSGSALAAYLRANEKSSQSIEF